MKVRYVLSKASASGGFGVGKKSFFIPYGKATNRRMRFKKSIRFMNNLKQGLISFFIQSRTFINQRIIFNNDSNWVKKNNKLNKMIPLD